MTKQEQLLVELKELEGLIIKSVDEISVKNVGKFLRITKPELYQQYKPTFYHLFYSPMGRNWIRDVRAKQSSLRNAKSKVMISNRSETLSTIEKVDFLIGSKDNSVIVESAFDFDTFNKLGVKPENVKMETRILLWIVVGLVITAVLFTIFK